MSGAGGTFASRPFPLLPAAVGLIAGIWVAEAAGGVPAHVSMWIRVAAVAWFAGGWALRKLVFVSPGRAALFLAVLALPVGLERHGSATSLPANHVARLLDREPLLTQIRGRIVSRVTARPPERRNPFLPADPPPRTSFVVEADALLTSDPPGALCGLTRVTVDAASLGLKTGDVVMVTGRLYRPSGPRNPGEIDWASELRLRGILAGLSVDSADGVRKLAAPPSVWSRSVRRIRTVARSLLVEPPGDGDAAQTAQLLETMVLGQRSAAGRDVNDAFMRTGTVHFLAVSGFHVGVLAMVTFWCVRSLPIGRRRAVAAIATLVAVGAYATVAEPNPPIFRAAIMTAVGCTAVLLGRPFCAVNWLALSAIVILFVQPLDLFRAGFQLSFVQVLVLVLFVPRVDRWLRLRAGVPGASRTAGDATALAVILARKVVRLASGLAIVCACAWFFSLPLVLHHFGRLAVYGPLHSLLVTPLVILLICIGFLAALLGWLPALGPLLRGTASRLGGWLLGQVEWLGSWPASLVETLRPPAWLVLIFYGAALLWLLSPRRRLTTAVPEPKIRLKWSWGQWASVAGTAALAAGWTLAPQRPSQAADFRVLAVGSGSAVLLTHDGRSMLFDCGTIGNFDVGATVDAAMRELRVRRLEAVFVSHANYDHFSGIPTLLTSRSVGALHVSPHFDAGSGGVHPFRQATGAGASRPAQRIAAGDRLMFGRTRVLVLWPPGELPGGAWEANDRSLVLLVEVNGRRILLTGDIERPALRALLAQHAAGEIDLQADVLVAPHHGAVIEPETEAFLEAVSPETVVVSTGKPRANLAELVSCRFDSRCRLLSTRNVGAICLRIATDGGIRAETPFHPLPHLEDN